MNKLALRWLLFGFGLSFPVQAVTVTAQGDGWVRLAVIATSQKGMGSDKPLRYAYRDGERLAEMLASVGEIDPVNLFLLKVEGKGVFQTELERIGERIKALKSQNKKVFLQFYFSGHGGAHNFHFRDGTFSFDEVKVALAGNSVDARVYVLDVCFGASFFAAKGFRTAPPVQLKMEMDQAAKGEVTISSSSVDEQAYEVKTLGGSIFTSQWILALRGAGDSNRDGQVTLFEAYNYASERTSGYSSQTLDRPQHPSYQMDLTGARDVMLAKLIESSTGILFKKCPSGLYNLVDLKRGIQIGELRIPEGDDFTLALEPGRYRIRFQPLTGPALAADVDLPIATMTPLAFDAFLPLAPGSGSGLSIPKGGSTGIEEEEKVETVPIGWLPAGIHGLPHCGYTGWAGMASFADSKSQRAWDEIPEPDRYFGFTGGFQVPAIRPAWGMEMEFPTGDLWRGGIRLGFGQATYAWKSNGAEPLLSVSDSLRSQYPVNLDWNYHFFDLHYGIFLGRNFAVTGSQSLRVDGSVGWGVRNIMTRHTVVRPLYETTTSFDKESTAKGYRLEVGLTWLKTLIRGPGEKTWLAGFRVAPYLATLNFESPVENHLQFDARELGLIATLQLTFQGWDSRARGEL
jgi:hypothetical protein